MNPCHIWVSLKRFNISNVYINSTFILCFPRSFTIYNVLILVSECVTLGLAKTRNANKKYIMCVYINDLNMSECICVCGDAWFQPHS